MVTQMLRLSSFLSRRVLDAKLHTGRRNQSGKVSGPERRGWHGGGRNPESWRWIYYTYYTYTHTYTVVDHGRRSEADESSLFPFASVHATVVYF